MNITNASFGLINCKPWFSDGNTCAYNDKALTLPLSNNFFQKWKSSKNEPLADYPLLASCIFKNSPQSGYKIDEVRIFSDHRSYIYDIRPTIR